MKIFIASLLTILINYNYIFIEQTYETKMLFAIQKMNNASTQNEYNKSISQFKEIITHHKEQWLPYYYMGLCKILIIFKLQEKDVDRLYDETIEIIDKCDSLSPNNSEVYVLRSMIYSAKLSVNPTKRGAKYNKLIYKTAEQSISFDKENPRAYLQKAQYIYHVPKNLGGGSIKAKSLFEEALVKFNSFKPKSNLMPVWGKDIAERMISICKQEQQKNSIKK